MSVIPFPKRIRLPPISVASLARLAGPSLVRDDDPSFPPPGWELMQREPCAAGHPNDEECDLCKGEAL